VPAGGTPPVPVLVVPATGPVVVVPAMGVLPVPPALVLPVPPLPAGGLLVVPLLLPGGVGGADASALQAARAKRPKPRSKRLEFEFEFEDRAFIDAIFPDAASTTVTTAVQPGILLAGRGFARENWNRFRIRARRCIELKTRTIGAADIRHRLAKTRRSVVAARLAKRRSNVKTHP